MFGFRTNTTRRKVYSNHQRPTKSTEVRPQVEISRLRVEQSGPSFDEAADDGRYDENSSVDMSLYTTQSKSTVHYSSRALVNYGNFENDSHDGYSCAQTAFTTEIALNRYFRLGGGWQARDHLLVTPTPHTDAPVSPDSEFMSPQSKGTEQTKELSPWSRNSTVSDDDSLNVISPTDSDCEQTICSLLPVTSKMARLAKKVSPGILQQSQKQCKTPLPRNSLSSEARDHSESENVTPNSLPHTTSKILSSAKGPIDLDDSVSMASSSNSCIVSFSGTAPPRIYRQAGNRLLTQVALSPAQTMGSRHPESTSRKSKDDEDISLFSSGDSSSAASSSLSLHYGTSTPQKSIEPVSVPMSISSGSWRGRSLQSPDQFSVDSLRDDDTYGFSIVSADCEKSVALYKASDMTPKVLLGELLEQWGDSYESNSAKWKPENTSRQGPPSHDMPLDALYSNAIAGGTKFKDHKSSSSPRSTSKTTVDRHSLDALRAPAHYGVTPRRPSFSSVSNERVIAKPNSENTPAQSRQDDWKDRTSTGIDDRRHQQRSMIEKDSAIRGIDMKGQNLPVVSKGSRETYTPALRAATQGVDAGNMRSYSSATTPRTVVVNDDDTFGFSTASPAPIPDLCDIETLGIRPSPLTRTGGGAERVYECADRNVVHGSDHSRGSIERRTHNATLHAILTRDQGTSVTGALLLTETELQKHLTKVQPIVPHPSTAFEGYDSWKRKQEEKQQYFAMLEAKAKQKKSTIDRRQPANGERSAPRVERRQQTTQQSQICEKKCRDSSRSTVDHRMDCASPTRKDGRSIPRNSKSTGPRRVWGWLQSGKQNKAQKKKGNKDTSHRKEKQANEMRHKRTEEEIVSLSHFMRISGDDDSEVIEFSTSPLHKDGIMSLGTSTLPDTANTDAATKSHYMHDSAFGTRGLLSQFVQNEREKQNLSELEKRKLTNAKGPTAELPPKPNKNHRSLERSIGESNKMPQNKPQLTKSRDEDSVVVQTVSVSSKQSVDSSMKSGSGKILSPCVICTSAERTHVAMPCMHFYFCSECVETLYKAECPTCPVCSTTDVVFTRVYTG